MCPPMRAYWSHLANTIEPVSVLRPTRGHNPNVKSIGSVVSAQRTAKSPYTLQWAPLSQNCHFPWGIWTPSYTRFLGPIRTNNPNSISIGSAVFTQAIAECTYTLQWAVHSPLKIALSHGGSEPHLRYIRYI